jgi:squalene-hopene/tetraprenyl-beta-curcumene cyclase
MEGVDEAIRRSQEYFLRTQHPDGYWWGELESNVCMAAEYLLLTHFLGVAREDRWRKIANYLRSQQRSDGTWAIYHGGPPDINATVESYFALKLAGVSADEPSMRKAREFVISAGGVPRVRIFTKIWLALFGQWDWRGVPVLPPEMMILPPWFPLNIYEFASWARATLVPMLIILTERPFCPVPDSAAIDELYPAPRDRTDYSLPQPAGRLNWRRFFHAADGVLRRYERGGALDRVAPGGGRLVGRHTAAVGVLADRSQGPGLSPRSSRDAEGPGGVRGRFCGGGRAYLQPAGLPFARVGHGPGDDRA